MSTAMRSELERLLSVCLDDEPNADEQARLNELLRRDAECRRYFLRQVDMHARLLQHLNPEVEPVAELPPTAAFTALASCGGPRTVRVAWRPYLLTALIAAGVSLLAQWLWDRPQSHAVAPAPAAVTALPMHGTAPPGVVLPRGVLPGAASTATAPLDELSSEQAPRSATVAYVATVVAVDDCRWADGEMRTPGTRLLAGWLRLNAGRAVLGFDGGARVTVEAPTTIKLLAANSAFIHRGRLSFESDDSVEPFEMLTVKSRLVDVGGHYAAVVGPQGEDVHVFAGELLRTARYDLSARYPQVYLTAGQARRFSRDLHDPGTSLPLDAEGLLPAEAVPSSAEPVRRGRLIAYDSYEARTLYDWRGAWAVHDPDTTAGLMRSVDGLRHASMPTDPAARASLLQHRITVSRLTPYPLRTDRDDTFYFSYLVRAARPSSDGKPCDVRFSFDKSGSYEPRRRLSTTVSWSRNSVALGWEGGGRHASVPLDYQRTYLVVGKVVVDAVRPDQAFVRLYHSRQPLPPAEPTDWTVVGDPVQSLIDFDAVEWSCSAEHGVTVDELRIGTAWHAVVAPYMGEPLPTVVAGN